MDIEAESTVTAAGRTRARIAVLAVVGLLVVVFAIAATSGPRGTGVSLPTATSPASEGSSTEEPPVAPKPTSTPSGEVDDRQVPLALRGIMLAVLVLCAVTVLWFVVRLLRRVRFRIERIRVETTESETGQEESEARFDETAQVRDAVAAGLSLLETDGDPRRAVIACWLRLEELAAEVGSARRIDDAPADLVARLLAERGVGADSLHRLADLYRRARFAPHAVEAGMRDEAREILQQLHSELDRVPT